MKKQMTHQTNESNDDSLQKYNMTKRITKIYIGDPEYIKGYDKIVSREKIDGGFCHKVFKHY